MDDRALLNQYLADRDERAFAQLVRRHMDMVYSAARRQVKDPSAAQDVTQHVFVSLAQKGGTIRDREALAGWLLTATRFAALDWLRSESRRRHYETEAAAMKQELFGESPDAVSEWESIQPVLDEAMSRLRPRDRDALALRYFRNLSLAEVGQELGITTDAANKRIERATDRLRRLFARRGVTTTGQMLSASLGAYAVTSAPAELAGQIAQQAVATSGLAVGSSLTMTKGAVLLMAATKTKVVIGISCLALAASMLVIREAIRPNEPAMPEVRKPATTPAWETRFREVYSLPDGLNVKRLRPPFIPERAERWAGWSTPPPPSWVLAWNGERAGGQTVSHETAMPLAGVLKSVADVWAHQVDLPRALLLTPVEGDWIHRESATPEQKVAELSLALGDVLGHGKVLQLQPMERDVVVVRGTFRFNRPLTPNGPRKPYANVTLSETPRGRESTGQHFEYSAGRMLMFLGDAVCRPVVIEANVETDLEVNCSMYRSADFRSSVEVPSDEVVDRILGVVSDQTSLHFSRERRTVPTWRLVPAGL